MKGIDVSSYQGKIDWEKVKPYIDFAILRMGYGSDYEDQDDVYFERNARLCKKYNIPFGAYLYSYATNLDDARSEVEHTLRLIKDKKCEYPIFLDVESKRQKALPKDVLTEIVEYYCDQLEKKGYYVGIYASSDTFKSSLSSPRLDRFDKWVAEWGENLSETKGVGMWQYTSYEELAGIKSRVDGDVALIDYPKIIRDAKLNHLYDADKKYRRGDKIYLSGSVYESSNAETIVTSICDEEFVIEDVTEGAAPYKIELGYVKEEEIYMKV